MKYNLILISLFFSTHALKSEEPGKERPARNYIIRKGTISDETQLKNLYLAVASISGGLARTADEITDQYVHKIIASSSSNGLIIVAEHENQLIGAIMIHKLEPKIFAHILSDCTIFIDPKYQGMGIGTAIIQALLNDVKNNHPEILRVELIARESNPAIKLYERLGFKKEGRFENRILGINNNYEADIPMAWFNPNFKGS